MNIQEFITKYQGQSVSYDGLEVNRGQCVQLVCYWCKENGWPVMWKDAANWWNQFSLPNDFDQIKNSPDPNNVPLPGDIIIWDTGLSGSGGYGHIAVVVDAPAGGATFTSFDSNWGGKTAHLVTHNWSNVIGWLRHKGVTMDTNAGIELYRTALHREPENTGAAQQWNGKTPAQAIALVRGVEWQITDNKVKNYDNLIAQIDQLSARPTKADLDALIAQVTTDNATIADLQAKLDVEKSKPPVNEQTVVQNWFIKIWNSLFKKG